jgi:hypothetical protein
MTFITRLANALRKDNKNNLFCILELGDQGPVWVFESGTGSKTNSPLQNIDLTALSNGDVNHLHRTGFARVSAGKSADAEQRMCQEFQGLWAKAGCPEHISIITAASPCNAKCSPAIRGLADSLKGKVKTWTVLYHAPYHKDGSAHSGTGSQLNAKEDGLSVSCSQLHKSFIDEGTQHGSHSSTTRK